MSHNKENLRKEIEDVRNELYQAYETKQEYHILLHISQKLDQLLNQLK